MSASKKEYEWRWQGWIDVNGGSSHLQTVKQIDVQIKPDGSYSYPPIHFYVPQDGYPKTATGFYQLSSSEFPMPWIVKKSGWMDWHYARGDDGAAVVDDFIAHGYRNATWHFIWTCDKLILSDYQDAYKPEAPSKAPSNDTTNTTIPLSKDKVPITNICVSSSSGGTIPMQNTGMPVTPLVIALISIIGALIYNR